MPFVPSLKSVVAAQAAAKRRPRRLKKKQVTIQTSRIGYAPSKRPGFTRISGYGDYAMGATDVQRPWYNRGGSAARGVGGYIGNAFGGGLGKAVGTKLGDWFHSLTGIGDYKYQLKRNTVLGMGTAPPMMNNSKSKSSIIRHREYIRDIYSSVGFVNQYTAPLNPGLVGSFPWLSQLATAFQEWRANGIVYEFKSTAGDAIASSNNSLGTVIMSTQYNANAVPFTNKMQMENEEFSTDCKPSCSFIHGIECARQQSPLQVQYVRSQAVPANDSPEFYDLGLFQVATNGQQTGNGTAEGSGSVNLGELWVTFEIELIKPQLSQGSGSDANSILSAHFFLADPTNTLPFNGGSLASGSNIFFALTPLTLTLNANQFPSGAVISMIYQVSGTSAALNSPSVTILNGSLLSDWSNASGPDQTESAVSGGTFTTFVSVFNFTVTNGTLPVVITFGTGGTYPTSGQGDIYITQMNSGLTT